VAGMSCCFRRIAVVRCLKAINVALATADCAH
jgi:hypothetical protein